MFLYFIHINKEMDKKRDAVSVIWFLGFDRELMQLKLYLCQIFFYLQWEYSASTRS